MKMKIAENIKALRKQHGFTQEQLSEALGVTVSAVYKWESALSVPEVKTLMELADLFEISVDTLLGYDRQSENISARVQRINEYVRERSFEDAILEAEKALKKYPNSFDVVYAAANVYMILFSDQKDRSAAPKAIELYHRAIALLYQCTNSTITEVSIWNVIGNIYIDSGQPEKGLDILKKNNICGINDNAIGLTYALIHRPEDAKLHLLPAYTDIISRTTRTMLGLLLMYGEQKSEQFLDAGTWLLDFFDSMVADGETVTFADRMKALLNAQLAVMCAAFGRKELVDGYITKAHRYATKFDSAPNYSPKGMKFLEGEQISGIFTDGMGETTIAAIETTIFTRAEPSASLEYVKRKFEVLKNEAAAE